MNCSQIIATGCFFCLAFTSSLLQGQDIAQDKVDFNTDIRPILADTCYKCHGPDENDRKADLRLDTKSGLLGDSGSVVPNDLDSSELYHRIISDDSDTLMPPADSGRVLSAKQKDLLKRWIEQGASWQDHWSLQTPTKPTVPSVDSKQKDWPTNPIDHFVLKRLKQEDLSPSKTADRPTLIRRVTFDLTGLPPKTEFVTKYTNLQDANWYEQLVDELLDSPKYGEHMARFWLDAARYGDTHGLHLDNYREMWPYRDWVVSAFNRNLSFRDFTIEQLAGDLLENPTDDQLIASGFNRAHITTNEGGAIKDEVYVRNVVDRVSTTGTIFMGMTVGCAQCHDHKFDPISQKEFYQLFAFFNNLTDPPMDNNAKNPAPVMQVISVEAKKKLAALETVKKTTEAELQEIIASFKYVEPVETAESTSESEVKTDDVKSGEPQEYVWFENDTVPVGAKKEGKWLYVSPDKGPGSDNQTRIQTGTGTVQHFFTGAQPLKAKSKDIFFANVFLDPKNPPTQVMLQFNDGNWSHRAYWGADKIDWGTAKTASRFYMGELPATGKWVRLEVDAEKVGFKDPSLINGIAFTQWNGTAHWDSAGIVSTTEQSTEFKSYKKWLAMVRETKAVGLPDNIKKLVIKPKDKLGEPGKKQILNFFLSKINSESSELFADPQKKSDQAKKAFDDLNNSFPTTLISKESDKIKEAFVLDRGEYDKKTEKVERITPAAMPAFSDELPKNRLGFAKWLTDGKHPLTARVTVNRYWQQFFGNGIVKSSEDFGVQGELPSHPELLDWLATDFTEHDWDVKRFLKLVVMSSTYRQSSAATPKLISKDPENRLFARGPRFRLEAEMLRDQALTVSGLLVETIGGPGVKPPQPGGLWFAVGYSGSNTVRFKKDSGAEKVHRRSLYTFWKRTSPPPQMNMFDAPSREECSVRRERTNTPLQALLLMNDPQYVEAARYFAQRTLDAELQSDGDRLEFIFQNALARSAKDAEAKLILADLEDSRKIFAAKKGEAKKLIGIGESPAAEKYDAAELASWTMITSLVMNMDEFVTKN